MAYEAIPGFAGIEVQLAPDANGRKVITGLKVEASAITAELLRRIPVGRIEQAANHRAAVDTDLPPLRREDATSPEDFSKLVAAHFKVWAQTHSNPVSHMARVAGVKPPTVHTWVREARLRGLLPPAKRRKG